MLKKTVLLLSLLIFPLFSFTEDKGISSSPDNVSEVKKDDILIENNFFSGILTTPIKKYMLNFLKENPFSLMSKKDVQTMLDLKLQDTPSGNFLKENPKVSNALIDVIRDKKAIPSFFSIVNETEKLKTYGICFIIVFIVAFIFNLKSKGNIFKRLFSKFLIMLGSTTANITCFYLVFKEELTPTVEIISKYL